MGAAFGTTLKKGATTPITIGKLDSIGAVELTANTEDDTTLDSPDGYEEVVVTTLGAGDVKVTGRMAATDAGQAALLTAFNAKESDTFEIDYPNGDKWVFTAFVTGVSMAEVAVKGTLKFGATLKIVGKPTFTAAA